MKRTPTNVLRILKRSGRSRLSRRQLTELCQEGLLPHPERLVKKGTNHPEYVWTEPCIVKQVAVIHDLLETWSSRHELLFLPLWLLGYDVPFERVSRLFLRYAESGLLGITRGKTDPEDLLDQISSIVYGWKFAPRRNPIREKQGVANYELVAEFLLSIFANVDYEVDDMVLSALSPLCHMRALLKNEQQDPSLLQEDLQQMATLARQLISLPMVREAMVEATQGEWEQAREDYLTVVWCVRLFVQACAHVISFPSVPEGFQYNVLAKSALLVLPLGISLRHNGYGHWIDMVLTKIRELMNDPELQERLATIDTWGEQIFQDAEAHYRLAH